MFRSSFKLIFFFLCLIPNWVICLNKSEDCSCTMDVSKKIVGGSESQLPGVVFVSLDSQYDISPEREEEVLLNKDYLCSAFVLNEKWVMTTKVCTSNVQGNLTVGVGYDKIEMIKQGKIKVKNIIDRDGFEISLLELETPINLNQFKPVCLDVIKKYEELSIKNFIGAGFGEVSPQKISLISWKIENLIPGKHKTEIRNLKETKLIEDFDRKNQNEYEMSLKSAKKKEALCFGDLGGPLYYLLNGKTFVVGLLKHIFAYNYNDEFGFICGGEGKAIYLKIAPHIDWIKEHLGENNYCDSMSVYEPEKKLRTFGLNKLITILKSNQ